MVETAINIIQKKVMSVKLETLCNEQINVNTEQITNIMETTVEIYINIVLP